MNELSNLSARPVFEKVKKKKEKQLNNVIAAYSVSGCELFLCCADILVSHIDFYSSSN